MKHFKIMMIAIGLLLAAGCTTVNELQEYSFAGSRIAGTMRIPPEPYIDMDYNLQIDKDNPLLTAVSVVSNLAKASQVPGTSERMHAALDTVDLPRLIWDDTYRVCLDRLSASPVRSVQESDFIFDLEILEYGLQDDGSGGAVTVEVSVMVRIYHTRERTLVWQRRIHEEVDLNPQFFGLHQDISNIITTVALSRLTEEQLAEGFRSAGRQTAAAITRRLEKDMYEAFFGG